ncbi:MAG: hypothetical protein ABIA66_00175 [Candidatus Omnitrophota bacterium]
MSKKYDETNVEVAVRLKDILKILGWSYQKFHKNNVELRDLGVIFYDFVGRPPRMMVRAFPSRLQRYLVWRSKRVLATANNSVAKKMRKTDRERKRETSGG